MLFEPIAIAASGGNKALAEGIDIMIQNNETNTISAIAVKSGPSVFNADSKKGRSRILQLLLNWHSKQKQGTKRILDIVMGKRRNLEEESQKCIRNWQENDSGQN